MQKQIAEPIRRPRQTQGGARQGIILLTLVSDYYHLHYHGVFPFGSCLLNRRSSSSNSSSSNQQQLDWMVFSHLATVFWSACLSKNPPTPAAQGGARQGIRQKFATASYYYYYYCRKQQKSNYRSQTTKVIAF